jgi:hypothetical protein
MQQQQRRPNHGVSSGSDPLYSSGRPASNGVPNRSPLRPQHVTFDEQEAAAAAAEPNLASYAPAAASRTTRHQQRREQASEEDAEIDRLLRY